MEIGTPERVYTIEPIQDPVPLSAPDETEEPAPERPVEPVEEPLPRP